MALYEKNSLCKITLLFCIFFASIQLATPRPLDGELWGMKDELVFPSLQRGPVTPSGPNPCTYIPGGGSGNCHLNGVNVAGHVFHIPAAAFPIVKGSKSNDLNNSS
ncbi:hypothetical protein SLE2022_246910 [Rubroshorea leprosula]|uniref:Uncharacterized protein n=1 Tax=Rubroshorea leprosula TaxID=152421 RepID=A0AAV5HLB2_9ROSI|nr:hypothetical protein SLEP1_g841 [Rubroshorea leprosula]